MDQYYKDPVYTERVSKVPEVTLGFWIVKILATTLGETGGDAVTMSMNLGYLLGTAIFAAIFAAAVVAQMGATRFHSLLYWAVIVATTTVGTTLADFVDRSLGIGYLGGSSLLAAQLIASLVTWHRALGTVSIDSINSNKAEIFYWITILFSQTLGTALGDWMADSTGLGYAGGADAGLDDVLPRRHPTSGNEGGAADPDCPAAKRTRAPEERRGSFFTNSRNQTCEDDSGD
jgi:uncharacterized membrane-anchored protein